MILAITTDGDSLGAPVNGSFQRCRNFLFYDTELADVIDVVENPERELPGGGGLEAAESIVGHNTDILITGRIDPEAGDVLGAGGVQLQICSDGSVRSAVERCVAGELPLAPGPGRGIYPGPGSPEIPHSRPAPAGSDPGREEAEEEVVGAEVEMVCVACGYSMTPESAPPIGEDLRCPNCGFALIRQYRAA